MPYRFSAPGNRSFSFSIVVSGAQRTMNYCGRQRSVRAEGDLFEELKKTVKRSSSYCLIRLTDSRSVHPTLFRLPSLNLLTAMIDAALTWHQTRALGRLPQLKSLFSIPQLVNRLNDHAQVMTKHLTQGFVDLRGQSLTAKSLTKLCFDHVKRSFEVGPLVIVRQEFFAVVIVEFQHPSPKR